MGKNETRFNQIVTCGQLANHWSMGCMSKSVAERVKKSVCRGSNWGPCACEAHMITTTCTTETETFPDFHFLKFLVCSICHIICVKN